MKGNLTLDETIDVARPLHEVFAYVSDFANVEQWDPAVRRAARLAAGQPGVGSQYRVELRAGLKLNYEIIEFEKDSRMLMTVDSRLFTAREEIRFDATRTGSRVRYIATFDFPAPLAGFNRLCPGVMDRIGKSAMDGLKRALEDDFDAPQPSGLTALADRLVLPGMMRFTALGYRQSRQRWNAVSAYQGKRRAIVTGATSGIGQAAARQLADLGARVTLIARDENKAQEIVAELVEQTGNEYIDFEIADLAVMADVHALCDRLLAADESIDILINNAGALFNPRQQTAEGFEKSFALLLLSPYILTERLHPLLKKGQSPRVINVLSGGMYTQKIAVNDLQSLRGEYSGSVAYARAKRGLMIVTEDWAERWQDDGIAVNAMHPGWVDTPGVETALPGFYRATRRFLRTPDEGADTAVWLATASEAADVSGKFWLDREQHPTHISARTRETPAEREQLLTTLAELLSPGTAGMRDHG